MVVAQSYDSRGIISGNLHGYGHCTGHTVNISQMSKYLLFALSTRVICDHSAASTMMCRSGSKS